MSYDDWTAGGALIPDAGARAAVLSAGRTLADELRETHGGISVFEVGVVGPLVAYTGLPEYVDAFDEMLAGVDDDEPQTQENRPQGPVWSPCPDVD